jgi:hypothetical protein
MWSRSSVSSNHQGSTARIFIFALGILTGTMIAYFVLSSMPTHAWLASPTLSMPSSIFPCDDLSGTEVSHLSPSPPPILPPNPLAVTFPSEPAHFELELCAVPLDLPERSFTETQHDVYSETGMMTDKAPSVGVLPWPSHAYHVAYDRFLGPLRNRRLSMLEIGLGCDMPKGVGASTFVWRRFLPCANLTILEFNGACAQNHVHLADKMVAGDQSNVADLERAVTAGGPFHVIIDDGGHSMKQQITSLRFLFPRMPPGGIYVIEDLHTSFMSRFQDNHGETTHQFISDIESQLHHAWERLPNTFEPLDKTPSFLQGADQIAKLAVGVSCFREICVLERNGVFQA